MSTQYYIKYRVINAIYFCLGIVEAVNTEKMIRLELFLGFLQMNNILIFFFFKFISGSIQYF